MIGVLDRAFAAAREAAEQAGTIQRRYFRTSFEVESKSDDSPVTIADRQAETAIREVFARHMPECGVLGEEFGASGSSDRRWVVDPLDATANFVAGIPLFAVLLGLEIDGRLDFGMVYAPVWGHEGHSWWAARGRGAFCCEGLPTAIDRGTPLAVSRTSTLETAQIAHGGLDVIQRSPLRDRFPRLVDRVARTRGFGDWWGHCLVAEGRVDAMVEGAVAYHDVAALVPIIEAAGGRIARPADVPLGPGYSASFASVGGSLPTEFDQILFA